MTTMNCKSSVAARRSQSVVDTKPDEHSLAMLGQCSSLCEPRSISSNRHSTDDITQMAHTYSPLTSTYFQSSLHTYPSAPILATPSTLSYTVFRAKMDPVYGQPTGHNMGRWQSSGPKATAKGPEDKIAKGSTFVEARSDVDQSFPASLNTFIDAGIPMSNGTLFAPPSFPQQTLDQFSYLQSVVDLASWTDNIPASSSFSSGICADTSQSSSVADSYDSSFGSTVSTTVFPSSTVPTFAQSSATSSSPVVTAAGNPHSVHRTVASADRVAAYTTADIQSIVYRGPIPAGPVTNCSVLPWGTSEMMSPSIDHYPTPYMPVGDTFVDNPINLNPRNLQSSFLKIPLYPDIAHPRPQHTYNIPPTWAGMSTSTDTAQDDIEVDDISRRRSELRKKHDKILLEERAKGMSYTDIIAKYNLPGENATWRGRYRYLTRPPHERKRKVSWTNEDTDLLRTAVCASSPMLHRLAGDFTSIIQQQPREGVDIEKLGIDWAQAAAKLQDLGCSYKFSVIACKKEFRRILGCESKPRLEREHLCRRNARPWRVPGYASVS